MDVVVCVAESSSAGDSVGTVGDEVVVGVAEVFVRVGVVATDSACIASSATTVGVGVTVVCVSGSLVPRVVSPGVSERVGVSSIGVVATGVSVLVVGDSLGALSPVASG